MKRNVILLIVLLLVAAGAIGPPLYMKKALKAQQAKVEDIAKSYAEQGNTANQNQPGAGAGEISAEANKSQPSVEMDQNKPAPGQQAGESNSAARENAVPAQAPGDIKTVTLPESGCKVWIAIVGENGELLNKAGQVVVEKDNKWGVTALGVLDTTGIPYTTMPTWPDFVASISGQANKGTAGWMYSVNGEAPMHMASKHPVKTGDKVIWWYSKSMEQPMPLWEDLAR